MRKPFVIRGLFWLAFSVAVLVPGWVQGQGVFAPGLGPINRSMGSASVATSLDGMGAIHWNPATLSGIENSEVAFSVELLVADIEASSFVPGMGGGTTESDSGAMPLPNFAWVHKTSDPHLTIGLGVLSVAGFKTNYPVDPTNPILAPQRRGATPGGFGRVESEAGFIDIAPTISYAFSERLAVGFSPVLTMGRLDVTPLVFAGVNDADGDNAATYPEGGGSRYQFGGGFNAGLYYVYDECWRFGASVKSPRWMDDFTYDAQDEVGNPLTASFGLNLPMVVSVGTSYSAGDRYIVAVDVRYFDYENAEGFGDSGVDANGRLRGLGWESVFAVATGIQYRLTETITTRFGYVYNDSPIPDAQTQFNIPAPLHYEHTLSCGLTYEPSCCLSFHANYSHSLESDITGQVTLPPNPPTATPPFTVPGSSVTSSLTSHAFTLGMTVKY